MNTDTKVIIGTVVVSVIVLLGAVVYFGNDKTPKRENLGTGTMTIDKKLEDFGDMKADEEKTATFTITNTSDSVLRIWGVATSCDCTFATVVIGNVRSEEFNMPGHMPARLQNWIGEVPAAGNALLQVIYRPKVMPVVGVVTRQVKFSTNDPKNPEVEVSIKANVL